MGEQGRLFRSGPVQLLTLAVVLIVAGATACASSSPPPSTAAARPLMTPATAVDATSPTAPSQAAAVTVENRILTDSSRSTPHAHRATTAGRVIVVRLWVPSTPGRRALVLLAPGLGGEPTQFNTLASFWARAGFVVAAPQFPSSSLFGGAGTAGARDLVQQPADVRFVLDRLGADQSLRVDATRVGVAGLAEGGATIEALTTDRCCLDHRIRAAAVFEGPLTRALGGGQLVPNTVPMLMLYCDKDPDLRYQDAAVPGFARLQAPAWLVTMRCAEHSQPYDDTTSPFDQLVERVTLDLWQATLQSDPGAMARISTDVDGNSHAAVLFKG